MQLQPTRDKPNLDLFSTTKPNLVKTCKAIPGISDHHAVLIDMGIRAQTSKKPPHNVNLWSKAPWDDMHAKTRSFTQSYQENCLEHDTHQNYECIENHIKSLLAVVPSKMTRSRVDLPWFTQDLRRQCKWKQRLYNRTHKKGKPEHNHKYKEAQKSFLTNLKACWQYFNNILCQSLEKGNNKPFLSYVRGQREDNVGVSPLKKTGQLHSDHREKCEILADQFSSVLTKDCHDPHRDTALHGLSYPPISERVIREEGVCKLSEGIKPNKAAGPDQISCQILKELATELAPALTSFFQQSLHTGDLPLTWLTAWVAPIFKKGPRSEPANYRPVSLTCITCKMLEHIICSHIRAHMHKHGTLTSFNYGFRSKHSCESQLLLTTHDLTRMDRREQVDVAVLDFSKTFDTVPHLRLLRKLELLGIHGELLTWIRSFLSARTQRVMIEGCHSKAHSVDSGVPQGTVLGPLLFLCFINDLPSVVDPHTSVRLFADDCLLYRSIRSMSDKVQVQCDLDALSKGGIVGECILMSISATSCKLQILLVLVSMSWKMWCLARSRPLNIWVYFYHAI